MSGSPPLNGRLAFAPDSVDDFATQFHTAKSGGTSLFTLFATLVDADRPAQQFLDWHREEVFRGRVRS
jgi:hypothetical protein